MNGWDALFSLGSLCVGHTSVYISPSLRWLVKRCTCVQLFKGKTDWIFQNSLTYDHCWINLKFAIVTLFSVAKWLLQSQCLPDFHQKLCLCQGSQVFVLCRQPFNTANDDFWFFNKFCIRWFHSCVFGKHGRFFPSENHDQKTMINAERQNYDYATLQRYKHTSAHFSMSQIRLMLVLRDWKKSGSENERSIEDFLLSQSKSRNWGRTSFFPPRKRLRLIKSCDQNRCFLCGEFTHRNMPRREQNSFLVFPDPCHPFQGNYNNEQRHMELAYWENSCNLQRQNIRN